MKRFRLNFSDDPGCSPVVKENPGCVFAVIGPFDNFEDRHNFQLALEHFVGIENRNHPEVPK